MLVCRYLYLFFFSLPSKTDHLLFHRGVIPLFLPSRPFCLSRENTKGTFLEKRREIPPREPGKFIVKLNEASIPTRYPVSLANLQRVYSRVFAKDILSKGRELVTWKKQQL